MFTSPFSAKNVGNRMGQLWVCKGLAFVYLIKYRLRLFEQD